MGKKVEPYFSAVPCSLHRRGEKDRHIVGLERMEEWGEKRKTFTARKKREKRGRAKRLFLIPGGRYATAAVAKFLAERQGKVG